MYFHNNDKLKSHILCIFISHILFKICDISHSINLDMHGHIIYIMSYDMH